MIFIYSRDTCAPCIQLRAWLDNHRYEYKVLDTEAPEHMKRMMELTKQIGIPVVVIGERVLVMPAIWMVKQAIEEDKLKEELDG